MHDIDDLIADDESEAGRASANVPKDEGIDIYAKGGREQIGEVERFFGKIGVAAIRLSRNLDVGNTIEVEGGLEPVRVRVSSMQINHKEVSSACAGDSVGIKVDSPVREGSRVYIV